jgi:hypothetical protein
MLKIPLGISIDTLFKIGCWYCLSLNNAAHCLVSIKAFRVQLGKGKQNKISEEIIKVTAMMLNFKKNYKIV